MALTDAQRTHLEQRLREERARLQTELNGTIARDASASENDSDGDLSSYPTHLADRGTDTMREELEASNETRMSRELAEIDAALDRLINAPEQYGVAEDTGEPIPFERLDIIPWARSNVGDA